ncbi:MAG: class II glutamine amidotransferase [Deltaproteobacteria bacterium]|nr:class II glutamine amidotransferase [Deltaproteobacteria bacterium]
MLIALMQSDAGLLPCRLRLLEPVFHRPEGAEEPGAVGAGYVSNGHALVQKGPGSLAEHGAFELLAGVKAPAAIVHLRRATVGGYREENTHPFRHHNWLFAHDGTVAGFGDLRPSLVEGLPSFLQRAIAGDTDTEHVFAVFLAELAEADLLKTHHPAAADVAAALSRTITRVEHLATTVSGDGHSTLDLVATNGRALVASRVGARPLWWTELGAIETCEVCGLDADTPANHPLRLSHDALRTVVVSTLVADTTGWNELEHGQILAWDQDLNLVRITTGE